MMSNDDKAKAILSRFKFGTAISPIVNDVMYDAVVEMAKEKDQQFKEYLGKKIEEINNRTPCCEDDEYINADEVRLIKEIINELFEDGKDNRRKSR